MKVFHEYPFLTYVYKKYNPQGNNGSAVDKQSDNLPVWEEKEHFGSSCSCVKSPAGGHAYPRLPALDVRLHSEVLCLSWDFMMLSCLCLRSSRMALNSSSSHRSDRTGSDTLRQDQLLARTALLIPQWGEICTTMLSKWLSVQNAPMSIR